MKTRPYLSVFRTVAQKCALVLTSFLFLIFWGGTSSAGPNAAESKNDGDFSVLAALIRGDDLPNGMDQPPKTFPSPEQPLKLGLGEKIYAVIFAVNPVLKGNKFDIQCDFDVFVGEDIGDTPGPEDCSPDFSEAGEARHMLSHLVIDISKAQLPATGVVEVRVHDRNSDKKLKLTLGFVVEKK